MNILLTTHVFPWPATSGASIRAAQTIAALGRLGALDVLCVVQPDRVAGRHVPSDAPVARVSVLGRPDRLGGASGNAARLGWLLGTGQPWKLARDYSEVRDRFAAWSRARYDLAWLGRAEGFAAFADLVDAPIVCDLDDLEDRKLAARAALNGAARDSSARRGLVAARWAGARDRVDRARWSRLHTTVAGGSAAVAVCSDLDAQELAASGVTNVEVVPNVYPEPPEAVGGAEVGEPPVILFAGVLTYEPNIDAARFLVGSVLPRLRRRLPAAEVRLVGGYDGRVADLARVAGVTLTGAVPEMVPELARADVIAVPIRYGGGTRIKILEAFAHRIPVVSTTAGAEGLDVVRGDHLLVADDPEAFAAACERAMDPAVRGRLATAGHDLWSAAHRPDAMQRRVAEIAARRANYVRAS